MIIPQTSSSLMYISAVPVFPYFQYGFELYIIVPFPPWVMCYVKKKLHNRKRHLRWHTVIHCSIKIKYYSFQSSLYNESKDFFDYFVATAKLWSAKVKSTTQQIVITSRIIAEKLWDHCSQNLIPLRQMRWNDYQKCVTLRTNSLISTIPLIYRQFLSKAISKAYVSFQLQAYCRICGGSSTPKNR